MALASFRLDVAGVRRILSSDEVLDALESEGEAIAQRARDRGVLVEGEPGAVPIPVEVVRGDKRYPARVFVSLAHPAGLAVESKHRLLGGSLG